MTRDIPQPMLVLTNIYNDMGTIMTQYMSKMMSTSIVCSIAHTFGWFANNKSNPVNLRNQQTDHKSYTSHTIDHA